LSAAAGLVTLSNISIAGNGRSLYVHRMSGVGLVGDKIWLSSHSDQSLAQPQGYCWPGITFSQQQQQQQQPKWVVSTAAALAALVAVAIIAVAAALIVRKRQQGEKQQKQGLLPLAKTPPLENSPDVPSGGNDNGSSSHSLTLCASGDSCVSGKLVECPAHQPVAVMAAGITGYVGDDDWDQVDVPPTNLMLEPSHPASKDQNSRCSQEGLVLVGSWSMPPRSPGLQMDGRAGRVAAEEARISHAWVGRFSAAIKEKIGRMRSGAGLKELEADHSSSKDHDSETASGAFQGLQGYEQSSNHTETSSIPQSNSSSSSHGKASQGTLSSRGSSNSSIRVISSASCQAAPGLPGSLESAADLEGSGQAADADVKACLPAHDGRSSSSGSSNELAMGSASKLTSGIVIYEDGSTQPCSTSPEDAVTLLRLIGAGSFGMVHLAAWKGGFVAIKSMLLPAWTFENISSRSSDMQREQMVVHEAAISTAVRHPNIVSIRRVQLAPMQDLDQQMGPSNLVLPVRNGFDAQPWQLQVLMEYCDQVRHRVAGSGFWIGWRFLVLIG
jgi:hypothetical protein